MKNQKTQPAAPSPEGAVLPDLSKELDAADAGAEGTGETGETPETVETETGLTPEQEEAQLAAERELVDRREAEAKANAAGADVVEVADVKTPEQLAAEAAEARTAVGVRFYVTVGGSALTDPSTMKVFTKDQATKSELTGWLEFQIAHNKIKEA